MSISSYFLLINNICCIWNIGLGFR